MQYLQWTCPTVIDVFEICRTRAGGLFKPTEPDWWILHLLLHLWSKFEVSVTTVSGFMARLIWNFVGYLSCPLVLCLVFGVRRVVVWDHTLQNTGVLTHSTQRPRDNFDWDWRAGTMMILGCNNSSVLLWVGCDGYVYLGYTEALWAFGFVDHGCLWLCWYIE